MKIKQNKLKKSLLNLHLIKYQFYKNIKKIYLNNFISALKKSLKVINDYHLKKKSILFVGFSYNNKLQNQVNHKFVTKNFFIKYILNSAIFLKNKPDLIVFNLSSKKELANLKLIKKLHIPLVLFTDYYDHKNVTKNYIIESSLNKNYIKSFCLFLVFSVLTKSVKLKF